MGNKQSIEIQPEGGSEDIHADEWGVHIENIDRERTLRGDDQKLKQAPESRKSVKSELNVRDQWEKEKTLKRSSEERRGILRTKRSKRDRMDTSPATPRDEESIEAATKKAVDALEKREVTNVKKGDLQDRLDVMTDLQTRIDKATSADRLQLRAKLNGEYEKLALMSPTDCLEFEIDGFKSKIESLNAKTPEQRAAVQKILLTLDVRKNEVRTIAKKKEETKEAVIKGTKLVSKLTYYGSFAGIAGALASQSAFISSALTSVMPSFLSGSALSGAALTAGGGVLGIGGAMIVPKALEKLGMPARVSKLTTGVGTAALTAAAAPQLLLPAGAGIIAVGGLYAGWKGLAFGLGKMKEGMSALKKKVSEGMGALEKKLGGGKKTVIAGEQLTDKEVLEKGEREKMMRKS